MLFKKILAGIKNKKSKFIAEAISIIENEQSANNSLSDYLILRSSNSYRIGITGPPGAGKSSIVNQLIKSYRKQKKSVGVLLVDPTSPFSKGALLGDRIRMNDYYNDKNIFIRSLATRGSKGGLSNHINDISNVLEYAGFDIIIYETVGVGQVELDVVELVDTIIVTLVPESGDDIQMMKAGLIEIADIYTINKYDRKDADKLYLFLNNMLSFIEKDKWVPKIVKTIAIDGKGIDDLINQISKHQEYLIISKKIKNKMNDRYLNTINNKLLQSYKKSFWNEQRIEYLNKALKMPFKLRKSPSELIEHLKLL